MTSKIHRISGVGWVETSRSEILRLGENETQQRRNYALYRRARTECGTYFFTVVTNQRRQIFCQSRNVTLLREAFGRVMKKTFLFMDAFVFTASISIVFGSCPMGIEISPNIGI